VSPSSQRSKRRSLPPDSQPELAEEPSDEKRQRILNAAFASFMAHGFSETSTLEIATRARVSKRELYGLVGTKEDMLVACILGRTARMRWTPESIPELRDPQSLMAALEAFGSQVLGEVTHPTVLGVYQLAIAEANRAPAIARTLQAQGRDASRAPLKKILVQAREAGLLQGDCTEIAEQFTALLWGDLMIGLLLRLAPEPTASELKRRARSAAAAIVKLHGR
jgi:AcrR family transcriptional regulator